AAVHDVRLHARDSKLLVARDVEMTELADRGNVAQRPEEIELALLGDRRRQSLAEPEYASPGAARGGIVGGRASRVADLLLDLGQELLDARGGRDGVRPLDPDDGPLRLPVGEIELDEARGHQHAPDQEEEHDDVLAEEPALEGRGRHRRKASARSRIVRGTVRPSSSEVLRLTARSIRSAPSTGRS